jgi:two-component system, cell cycle sensor histidine kinase and response regulator CckA
MDMSSETTVMDAEQPSDEQPPDQALDASAELLRHLVEHAAVGIYRTTPDGRVLMANPAMASLLGLASAAELESSNLEELARRLGYPREELKRRLEETGQVIGLETSWTRHDGSVVHIRENTQAVRDGSGRVAYYEGTAEDLTARVRLDERLRRTHKMEAIGRLAGGIAHAFNNVMQAMLSESAMLRSYRDNPDRHEDVLTELEEQIRRASALTRQLLLFSKCEVTRLEILDLNEVIRASASLLQRIVRENVRFSVDLFKQPLWVCVDHGQLDQVLLNLVLNSSEALPDGGELRITSGTQEPSIAWFEVADNGCGIPDEIRERIFEPFVTTKQADGAAGLGLAVIHGIVAAQKGTIEVSSTVGSGSVFRVSLPMVPSAPRPQRPTLGDAFSGVEGRGERVLVVEDEPGARQGLRDVLQMLGYEVAVAGDAETALVLPQEPPFAVLLCDIMLPGLHGWELATRLEERWPGIRVILMSGYTDDEGAQQGVANGKLRFLHKPFDMVTLARELRAALGETRSRT